MVQQLWPDVWSRPDVVRERVITKGNRAIKRDTRILYKSQFCTCLSFCRMHVLARLWDRLRYTCNHISCVFLVGYDEQCYRTGDEVLPRSDPHRSEKKSVRYTSFFPIGRDMSYVVLTR